MDPAIAFGKVATDETPLSLDLNKLVAARPSATFFMSLAGDVDLLGWKAGDIVVIDRSLTPRHGQMVVTTSDGDFGLRHYLKTATGAKLFSLSGSRQIAAGDELWGVVTYVIHRCR